jgi:GxxExxY protein
MFPNRKLELVYKGRQLEQTYEPDFVCFGKVILEIKAVKQLNDVFRSIVHHYLNSTSIRLGLLVNFASYPKLEFERIVR